MAAVPVPLPTWHAVMKNHDGRRLPPKIASDRCSADLFRKQSARAVPNFRSSLDEAVVAGVEPPCRPRTRSRTVRLQGGHVDHDDLTGLPLGCATLSIPVRKSSTRPSQPTAVDEDHTVQHALVVNPWPAIV